MEEEEKKELELEFKRMEEEKNDRNIQRSCGPQGCEWCQTFIEILCCPFFLITFILRTSSNLLNTCIYKSTELWNTALNEYMKRQEEKKLKEINKDKTVTNWFKTLYHIVFELYKVVISSFLTIFTQQKCYINNTNEITTCTMYDNFYNYNNSQLQIAGLAINFITFSVFIIQYIIEILREHYLIKYLEYNSNIANNSVNLEQVKNENNKYIFKKMKYFYKVYIKVSQIVLIMYLINIGVSSAVVYNNYLNKSSIIGFVTNSLFVFIKIGSIIEITSERDNIYYSAYRKQHIHYNSLNDKTFKKYNYVIENNNDNDDNNDNDNDDNNDNNNDNDNDNKSGNNNINSNNPYYYDEDGIILEIIDEPEIEMISNNSDD